MSESLTHMDLPKVISPEEVGTLLQKSRSWVYGHAAELGASKIGSAWIFTKEGLSEALRNGRKENTAKQNLKPLPTKTVKTRLSSKEYETVKEGLQRHNLI